MRHFLDFQIQSQPDETTCGPTCLHSVYRYFGDELPLEQVVAEVPRLQAGGTLGVHLGCHALSRGYAATLYTYNLQVFDPTWFAPGAPPLVERLAARRERRVRHSCDAYRRYLDLGGQVFMEDLTPTLLRRHLEREVPVLTGLSSTFLYRCSREHPETNRPDDVGGQPVGHFVVLCGYDPEDREVMVADPYRQNPLASGHRYPVNIDRAVGAILLGVLTYDANLLVIEPRAREAGGRSEGTGAPGPTEPGP